MTTPCSSEFYNHRGPKFGHHQKMLPYVYNKSFVTIQMFSNIAPINSRSMPGIIIQRRGKIRENWLHVVPLHKILDRFDISFVSIGAVWSEKTCHQVLSSLVNGKSTLKWDAFVTLLVTKQVDRGPCLGYPEIP